jgi:hypothetical protein
MEDLDAAAAVGGKREEPPPTYCVTGATGYIGSWLVKTLLERGYKVHATVRDPGQLRNSSIIFCRSFFFSFGLICLYICFFKMKIIAFVDQQIYENMRLKNKNSNC